MVREKESISIAFPNLEDVNLILKKSGLYKNKLQYVIKIEIVIY